MVSTMGSDPIVDITDPLYERLQLRNESETPMDSQQNTHATTRLSTIPRIRRRPTEWVGARPSKRLHLGLAFIWLAFLASLPSADADTPLGFVDMFATAMAFVTTGGIFSVVALAIQNHKATAPVSVICGLGVIVVAAMCGFVGHPTSTWGPDAVLAAGIVALSAAMMMRRESTPAS